MKSSFQILCSLAALACLSLCNFSQICAQEVLEQPLYPHSVVIRVNLPQLGGVADKIKDVGWLLKDASDSFKTKGCELSNSFYNKKAGILVLNLTDAYVNCDKRFRYKEGDSLIVTFTAEKLSKAPVQIKLATRVEGRGIQEIENISGFILTKPAESESATIPTAFKLYQNYPNPFNPETRIRYDLPEAVFVTLEIYNVSGQKVRTLVHEPQKAQSHSAIWDGLDDTGRQVASGIYLYKIKAGKFMADNKMLFLK